MADVGQWVVGVTLKFSSNTSTEIEKINKALKALRDGEISRTQKALDLFPRVATRSLDPLAAKIAKVSNQMAKAAQAVHAYANAFDAIKAKQTEAFRDVQASVAGTSAMMSRALQSTTGGTTSDVLRAQGLARDAARRAQREAEEQARSQEASDYDRLRAQGTSRDTARASARAASEQDAAKAAAADAVSYASLRSLGISRDAARVSDRNAAEQVRAAAAQAGEEAASTARASSPGARFGRFFYGGGRHLGGFAQGLALPGILGGGLNGMVVGMALRDGISNAIGTGAGFQQYLNIAANMGDMTSVQKARWGNTMLNVSGKTGINPVDVMHSSLDVVRLMKGTMSVDSMNDIAPKLFQAAKVLEVTRGYNHTKAIDNLVEITHMLHDYRPARMSSMLDLMLGASELISQDPQKLKTQMAYFAGAFKNAGISDKDTFASIVMASRAGMGTGKGGTSLNNFLGAILGQADLTSFRAALRKQSVQRIVGGSVDKFYYSDKPGDPKTLHIMDMIQNVAAYAVAHPGWKTIPELNSAFGIQGSRFASLMADPETAKAFAGTRKALNDPNMNVSRLYDVVMNNLPAQIGRVKTSFADLSAVLIPALIPSLTNVTRSFADLMEAISSNLSKDPHLLDGIKGVLNGAATALTDLGKALKTNPQLVSNLGEIARIVGTLAAVKLGGSILGVVGNLSMIPALMKYISSTFLISGSISAATLASAAALPIAIGAVIAAIGMAVFFPKHFKMARDIVSNTLKNLAKWVASAIINFAHSVWNDVTHIFFADPSKRFDMRGRSQVSFPDDKDKDKAWNDFSGTPIGNFLKWAGGQWHNGDQSVPHAAQVQHGKKAAQVHVTQNVEITGNIYGDNALKQKVAEAIAQIAKNPFNVMGTNLSNTRTHPNLPPIVTAGW